MNRTERFYKIDQMIQEHGSVPFAMFRERLEVSRATIKRDLEYMRNRLNAPIVWDRDARGYRFGEPERLGGQYELPGLWFSSQEIHALLTMQHLLATLEPGGLLGPHIRPLLARLNGLLGTAADTAEEIRKRVKIIAMARRTMAVDNFEKIGSALLRRRRVQISYRSRSKDEVTEREISPQRLVHYRDNWYLDAWCHLRGALRSFAVDAILRAEVIQKAARNVSEKTLDQVLGSGYGIFSGRSVTWAKLKFSPERARWVQSEEWHPRQRGRLLRGGAWLLEVPYSDPRELTMDILKHGREVEVLGPAALRQSVRAELEAAAACYA
ncbi:MAG TPA: transcriptional regulator [Rhodocyclaceae bacterium]|nr:MAG: transcriptional regulator [Betaproteobacteria bacterium CG2_30_68_42]PIX75757.1 MAG: transcriptional regulator [Rhodocyclales bacterium CG_4_10_14_3_um_filter_68_10]HCX32703.1 transcriptional regulator [Rhodocyclaceae bacterium]